MALKKDIFKNNGFQFAARYVYDSGEISALGVITPIVKASEAVDGVNAHISGISSIDIDWSGVTHPTYARYMEVYARKRNTGTWQRVKTIDLGVSGATNFYFTGDTFETLSDEESSKPFDSLPFESSSIEVINNRVFLANNKDDLDAGDSGMSIALIEATSQKLTDSTTSTHPLSYLRYSNDLTKKVTDYGNNPFANSSLYKVGYALYDEFLRTRGVESTVDFQTGNFDYPIYPHVRITKTGAIPSWAKYYQLVITKNLDKDYSLEGFASTYFWIKNDTSATRLRKLQDSTKGDIKYFVIDISGMIRSGYTYTYQEGDFVNLNFDTTAGADEAVNAKIIRSLKILGQADNLIYVEFSAKEGFSVDAWNDVSKNTEVFRLFFEIYSPKAASDTVVFYETGIISAVPTNTTPVEYRLSTTPVQGDMVFQNIEVKGYNVATIPTDDTLPVDPTLDQDYNVLIRKVDATKSGSNWDVNIGKALIEYDGKQKQKNASKFRHGGKYIQGTSINPISSFFFSDEGEVPYENGAITSLARTSMTQSQGTVLLAICERETSTIYIGESILTDNSGQSFLSSTDKVIGTVRNLKGSYGSMHKRSVVSYGDRVYWWDDNKRKVVRYGQNGMYPISDYFMRSHFLGKSGGCVGFYDPFYDVYHIRFDSDTTSVAFSEQRTRWISEYDLDPVQGVVRGDRMLLFKTTNAYKSLGSGYLNFMGSSVQGKLRYLNNTPSPESPKNVRVYSNMNPIDYANPNNVKGTLLQIDFYNELGQHTCVLEGNFLLEDRVLFSHVMRDMNSSGGIVEGDFMNGTMHEVEMTLKDTTQEMRVGSILIESDNSLGHIS